MAKLLARAALPVARALEQAPKRNGFVIRELALLTMIRVQVTGNNSEVATQLKSIAGTDLPECGYYQAAEDMRLHWLTPKEWLIVAEPNQESRLMGLLESVVAADISHATVISDARMTLEITGPRVVELLSQACSLDLHSAHFCVGRSTVTRFAQLPALLSKTGQETFELTVDRAYARYTHDWMYDAIAGV
jgi:sarcosine oxidase subunit gamma